MIEYHGWIVIREGYCEEQESDNVLNSIIFELRLKIDELRKKYCSFKIELMALNGVHQISIFGCSNHYDMDWIEILSLINWISINAIGSYGLLYYNNSESNDNLENSYLIYCLKKGGIYKITDTLLSPFIEEIEE